MTSACELMCRLDPVLEEIGARLVKEDGRVVEHDPTIERYYRWRDRMIYVRAGLRDGLGVQISEAGHGNTQDGDAWPYLFSYTIPDFIAMTPDEMVDFVLNQPEGGEDLVAYLADHVRKLPQLL